MGRRSSAIAVLIAACSLSLIGCQSTTSEDAQSSPSSNSATVVTPGLVDIGGGRQIFARCEGSGSPAVVLISGQDLTSDSWRVVKAQDEPDATESDRGVFQQLAQRTQVCAYDRGNASWPSASRSTPVTQPVSAQAAVADLHAWLQAAQIPAPYVLGAHSFGGMIAVLYAQTYPDEVAGMVLVDPANRYLREVVNRKWWDAVQEQRQAAITPDGPEFADFDASADAIVAGNPVPQIPVVILSSDATPPEMIDEKHFPAWLRAHDLLAEELDATHITKTDSGHSIQIEQPDLVTQQFIDMVQQVPTSATSPK